MKEDISFDHLKQKYKMGYDYSSFEANVHSLVTADAGLPHATPTESFWQVPPHPDVSSVQSPELPTETDVVVIGSGITGCSVTKALLEDKYSSSFGHVIVLEARTLCSGATGRNGGHCVSAAGHKFSNWVETYGLDAARQIARFSLMNVARLREIVADMDERTRDRSEMRTVQKLCACTDEHLWTHHEKSLNMFATELPDLKDHNRLVGKEELETYWGLVDVVGGYVQTASAVWPYRLITEIFHHLVKTYPDRLAIETATPVTSVSMSGENAAEYLVTTPRGVIKTKRVVYCTNGYTNHLLPNLRGKIYPFRGHMTTQAVPDKFPSWGKERSWSLMQPVHLDASTGLYHHGLYYLQQNGKTKDVFAGVENQLIEECLCSDDSYVSEASRKDLPTLLPRMFACVKGDKEGGGNDNTPKLRSIWSGVMGMTSDGLPIVGRLPINATGRAQDGEEWVAAGFQGYGMDKCWLTGEALVAMMAGIDVSSWFPNAFVITTERVTNEMSVEKSVGAYVNMAKDTEG